MQKLSSAQIIVERLFGASLLCYPRMHREEFGAEMAQVFSDLCQEVYCRGSAAGLFGLWLAASSDIIKTALEMRFKELAHMTREHWTQLAGWALIIGAVTLAVGNLIGSFETVYWDQLGGFDALYEYGGLAGSVSATLLFSIGMFGLSTRYGRLAGPLGKWSLLLGGLAGLVALTGAILMALAAGDGWYIWISGFTLMFVGLLVFGVVGWRKQALERWRAAPILAGLGVPAMLLASVAFQVLDGNKYVSGVVLLIVAGNMFLLGHLLRGVSTRAAALAA